MSVDIFNNITLAILQRMAKIRADILRLSLISLKILPAKIPTKAYESNSHKTEIILSITDRIYFFLYGFIKQSISLKKSGSFSFFITPPMCSFTLLLIQDCSGFTYRNPCKNIHNPLIFLQKWLLIHIFCVSKDNKFFCKQAPIEFLYF